MVKGECRHKYPKTFSNFTTEVGGNPSYRRRSPADGGEVAIKQINQDKQWQVDNTRIVPYNPALLLQFNCHMNVEVASSVVAVKYLFKYVYKGHDRVIYSIQKGADADDPASDAQPQRYVVFVLLLIFDLCRRQVNEVQRYLDARYVSASEACWRIFRFRLQERSPNVERLPVHLPDGQQVFYNDDDT